MDRRQFLRTKAGMAAALIAMNEVFGDFFDVSRAEAKEPEAFEEKWPKDQFVFDIQTHHVDVSKKWYDDTDDGKRVASFFRMLRRGKTIEDTLDQLNRGGYTIKNWGPYGSIASAIAMWTVPGSTEQAGRRSKVTAAKGARFMGIS